MEMLANVSEQMKEAQEKGDTYKVKQLQRLLAVNLASNRTFSILEVASEFCFFNIFSPFI